MDELQSYWIKKWVNISYTRIVCQVCSGCVLANCVCVLRMCCMYYTSVKKLTSQHRASCSTLCSCAPRLAGEGAKTGRRMQWLAKLADVCVCACLFVLLQATSMYMHAIPNLASQRNLCLSSGKQIVQTEYYEMCHFHISFILRPGPGPGPWPWYEFCSLDAPHIYCFGRNLHGHNTFCFTDCILL